VNQPLRLLMVEDSKNDTELLLHALCRGGYDTTYEVVDLDSPVAMRTALECQGWDVITSDLVMPMFSGSAALALAKELRPGLPFIIVSGETDLNLAVALMREGAQDYVQQVQLSRLVPAIGRQLRHVEVTS
jgi:DNA-binding NtrC family response regulator